MIRKNNGGGEIVQVQGGHILRSTGRKDRHSKVFTAKGPRDRRVRLSAHTAIQFYDVQDRLRYDRPSKAVDWLIKKAKTAIDKLAELPPWNPNDPSMAPNEGPSEMTILGQQLESSSGYGFQMQGQLGQNPGGGSSFISDPMKSFFPMTSVTSPINFPATGQADQNLCLSLHSLQDPGSSHSHQSPTDQALFPGAAPGTFSAADYTRLAAWDGGGTGENREGYMFSTHSQPFFCQGSMVSQRGTLQTWNDQFAPQGILQFQAPPQNHREEPPHGVVSDEPSSASPNSHH